MTLDLNRILDEVLIPHEGLLTNGYRDTAKNKDGTPKGLFTCGVGHMVPTADACALLPWLRADGSQATPDEARACYRAVMSMAPGLRASAYAPASPLRLTVDWCRADAIGRLQVEFLPGLRRLFPGFDGYPPSPQVALVDEIYNMGEGGPPRPGHPDGNGLFMFDDLRAACEAGNWEVAASESHVRTSSDERNAWRARMFKAGASGA